MAYKTFVNGFPLTASELNEYLMNQSIPTFADGTARDAAITTPLEGQFAYLTGTNNLVKYDGSSWVEAIEIPAPGLTTKTDSYVITSGDANSTIIVNAGTTKTITVADVLSAGERIDFIQKGAGAILFDPDTGVNLYSAGSAYTTTEQYAAATVISDGTDYYLIGNLTT